MLSAYMAMIDDKALCCEFEKFYYDNRRLGMSKAYELLGDISMAEDALSEAFFRLAFRRSVLAMHRQRNCLTATAVCLHNA